MHTFVGLSCVFCMLCLAPYAGGLWLMPKDYCLAVCFSMLWRSFMQIRTFFALHLHLHSLLFHLHHLGWQWPQCICMHVSCLRWYISVCSSLQIQHSGLILAAPCITHWHVYIASMLLHRHLQLSRNHSMQDSGLSTRWPFGRSYTGRQNACMISSNVPA